MRGGLSLPPPAAAVHLEGGKGNNRRALQLPTEARVHLQVLLLNFLHPHWPTHGNKPIHRHYWVNFPTTYLRCAHDEWQTAVQPCRNFNFQRYRYR